MIDFFWVLMIRADIEALGYEKKQFWSGDLSPTTDTAENLDLSHVLNSHADEFLVPDITGWGMADALWDIGWCFLDRWLTRK